MKVPQLLTSRSRHPQAHSLAVCNSSRPPRQEHSTLHFAELDPPSRPLQNRRRSDYPTKLSTLQSRVPAHPLRIAPTRFPLSLRLGISSTLTHTHSHRTAHDRTLRHRNSRHRNFRQCIFLQRIFACATFPFSPHVIQHGANTGWNRAPACVSPRFFSTATTSGV